jgi:hypothetical protein
VDGAGPGPVQRAPAKLGFLGEIPLRRNRTGRNAARSNKKCDPRVGVLASALLLQPGIPVPDPSLLAGSRQQAEFIAVPPLVLRFKPTAGGTTLPVVGLDDPR